VDIDRLPALAVWQRTARATSSVIDAVADAAPDVNGRSVAAYGIAL